MAAARFYLEIQGPEKNWQLPLAQGITSIGRVQGNTLLLENQQVSRQHAQIICTETDAQVVDLNSSNGTYVDGKKLTPGTAAALSPADRIKIGPFVLALALLPGEENISPVEEEPTPEAAGSEQTGGQPLASAPEPTTPISAGEPEPILIEVPLVQAVAQHGLAGGMHDPSGNGEDGSNGSAPPGDGLSSLAGLDGFEPVPRGLTIHSQRLIHYLPGIYQTDFMERFLGIFESILTPIEWNVDNFDLFLDPRTAPAGFLPWLSSWFGILLQPQWSDAQRRAFLQRAHFLFARRGTRLALAELLLIFTGQPVEIDDTSSNLPANTFRVRLPLRKEQANLEQLSALIDAHKPAHTTYFLEFAR